MAHKPAVPIVGTYYHEEVLEKRFWWDNSNLIADGNNDAIPRGSQAEHPRELCICGNRHLTLYC